MDSVSPSDIAKMNLHNMPYICSCDTAYPSDTRRVFDPLKLHYIFGFCCCCNPKHITSAVDNATLIGTGETPTALSTFSTIPKAN